MSQSPEERIPEEDDTAEAPLTMAASVILTNLPRDASKALQTAGELAVQKGTYLDDPPPYSQLRAPGFYIFLNYFLSENCQICLLLQYISFLQLLQGCRHLLALPHSRPPVLCL